MIKNNEGGDACDRCLYGGDCVEFKKGYSQRRAGAKVCNQARVNFERRRRQ